MNPLFSVGEVVILQSVSKPECNGEYTVLIVLNGQTNYICPITCINKKHISSGIGYVLDINASNKNGTCIQWNQSALRKKHQPGEQSFSELMQTLKSQVSV